MLSLYLSMVSTPEDREKVEKIYYEYRKFMKYVALGILASEDMAEDAVAEALLRVVENIDKVKTAVCDDTKAFVYIIVRNCALNIYNKNKNSACEYVDGFDNYSVYNTDMFDKVYLSELLRAVKNLPAIYRDALQLRVYYDMSFKEIASVMNVSEDAARKRVERARKMLSDMMGGEQDDGAL